MPTPWNALENPSVRRGAAGVRPVLTIAKTLGVSRATVYRAIAEHDTGPSDTKTQRKQRN